MDDFIRPATDDRRQRAKNPTKTDRRDVANELVRRAHQTTCQRRLGLTGRTAEIHVDLADCLARRYRHWGPEGELMEVAHLALLRAVERFDSESEQDFIAVAAGIINEHLKHYCRQHTWAVRQ